MKAIQALERLCAALQLHDALVHELIEREDMDMDDWIERDRRATASVLATARSLVIFVDAGVLRLVDPWGTP